MENHYVYLILLCLDLNKTYFLTFFLYSVSNIN